MQNTSCEMPGWRNHKVESRLPGEISTTSDILHMIPPDGRKPRGTEEPLDENEKNQCYFKNTNLGGPYKLFSV